MSAKNKSNSKGNGTGNSKTPISAVSVDPNNIEQPPWFVVSLDVANCVLLSASDSPTGSGNEPDDTTKAPMPFYSLMFGTGQQLTSISDIIKYIDANAPVGDNTLAVSDPSIAEKLRSVIFKNLGNTMDTLFGKIKEEIKNQLATKISEIKTLTLAEQNFLDNFDCATADQIEQLRNLQQQNGKKIMVEMTFLDNLTAMPKPRTNYVSIETLCDNLTIFKNALSKQMIPTELFVSQSEFIKSYLAEIFNQKTMNVSTTRAFFETLTPETQCNESAALTWPSKVDPVVPDRFNEEYAWDKYCYICGLPIIEKTTGKSQCEHILFVLQACALKCLIQRRHKRDKNTGNEFDITNIKDPLSQALYKLAYAGAHICCNILKSNRKFITIDAITGKAKADRKEIEKIVNEIKNRAGSTIDDTDGLNCRSLKEIGEIGDTTMRVNEIIDKFVQPLVDNLNIRLGEVYGQTDKTPEYNRHAVLELFVRMNQILSLELSLEQVLCCILAGGEIKVPPSMKVTCKINNYLKNTLISETKNHRSEGDFYLTESYNTKEVNELIVIITDFLKTKIPKSNTRQSLKPSKSAQPAAEPTAEPTAEPAEPTAEPAKPAKPAENQSSAHQSSLVMSKSSLGDAYSAVKLGPDSGLQQLMVNPNGNTFKNVLFKKCFGFDIEPITAEIFKMQHPTVDVKPNYMFLNKGALFSAKLSYYFQNLFAMFYSTRPEVTKQEKNELTNLCKSYIALEVMYMLTYNLYTNKELQDFISTPYSSVTLDPVSILQKCLDLYNDNYKTFMFKWFLYSSIDVIQKSGLDYLLGPEGMNPDELDDFYNVIAQTYGNVYSTILRFFKTDPANLKSVLVILSQDITSDNITKYVTDALEQLRSNNQLKTKYSSFVELIRLKEYITDFKGYSGDKFVRLKAPSGASAIQPLATIGEPMVTAGGSVRLRRTQKHTARTKSQRPYGIGKMTRRAKKLAFKKLAFKKAFNKFVKDNDKIKEHIYNVAMLKVAVQNLGAYDVGSAFISKNRRIRSDSKNPIEIGICAKLNVDIANIKKIIYSNMKQRAEKALVKLGLCDKPEATSYANAISHNRDVDAKTAAINKIVQLMGVKLHETMDKPKPTTQIPTFTLTITLTEPERSQRSYISSTAAARAAGMDVEETEAAVDKAAADKAAADKAAAAVRVGADKAAADKAAADKAAADKAAADKAAADKAAADKAAADKAAADKAVAEKAAADKAAAEKAAADKAAADKAAADKAAADKAAADKAAAAKAVAEAAAARAAARAVTRAAAEAVESPASPTSPTSPTGSRRSSGYITPSPKEIVGSVYTKTGKRQKVTRKQRRHETPTSRTRKVRSVPGTP